MRNRIPVVAVVAAGGAAGACARYGLAQWLAPRPGAFPWATFLTNISGCLLIGVVVVLTTEAWAGHRLARPFLGTGVLGGYTTFSAYTLEIRGLAGSGHVAAAAVYLFGTLFLALAAVQAGMSLTRWATRAHRTERSSR